MNPIEEELWNYIDGHCGAEEKEKIAGRISTDLAYQHLYHELLEMNKSLEALEFEEPSMSFNRNVMEMVNDELPPVALKTKIDHRVIYTIAALFAACIVAIFSYAVSISSFSFEAPKMTLDLSKVVSPLAIQLFVFVDVALGLIYLDSLLRKRKSKMQQ